MTVFLVPVMGALLNGEAPQVSAQRRTSIPNARQASFDKRDGSNVSPKY